MVLAIGNYTGRVFMYWENDNGEMPLEELSKYEPKVLDTREQPEIINGKCAHAIEAFEGTRYSIV